MLNVMEGLKPELFWKCFSEISTIPRPSGQEEKIAQFVMDRAKTLGLPARQDPAGNVVVTKPASPGMESRQSICLQAHLDMVCEKNADKVHDFLSDPIELVRNGDLLMANGTTLGADNGVGVATSLAVMEETSLKHGPLEFLFTVEEETGLTGALNLDPRLVESRILVNLDSEEEGEVYVGCAGGKDTLGRWQLDRGDVPADHVALNVTVKGLKGGHSGLEIDKGYGNAIKLINRALLRLSKVGGRLSRIDGGNMRNAIPRECTALISVPAPRLDEVHSVVSELDAHFRSELSGIDPGVTLTVREEDLGDKVWVLDQTLQQKLMLAIAALPTGVQHMSHDIPGLVETSTNVAVITTSESDIVLITSQRSSVASRLSEVVEAVESIFRLAGAAIEGSSGYPGWKPNLASPILSVAKRSYRSLFGKDVEVKAIHAGLECGIIGERIPGMDMLSFGPTMAAVHSPDENIQIPSVEKYWAFLLEILKSVG